MRFAASRLPNRLTSVGSSEAVIQSSVPSTPEQLHAEHGNGRRRAGTEVGDTRRGAVARELSSDVEFDASAAPHSRKRPHGLMVTRCTDPNSRGYDPLASYDDGSCPPIFEG